MCSRAGGGFAGYFSSKMFLSYQEARMVNICLPLLHISETAEGWKTIPEKRLLPPAFHRQQMGGGWHSLNSNITQICALLYVEPGELELERHSWWIPQRWTVTPLLFIDKPETWNYPSWRLVWCGNHRLGTNRPMVLPGDKTKKIRLNQNRHIFFTTPFSGFVLFLREAG